MRRLVCLCALSVWLYIAVFAFLVDRPLSIGLLRLELDQKTARLARLPSPKLIILAGSNGPYSHACAVLGPMLGLPCENGGIAVGIGLDDLFARYAPYIRAGDVVYMPMELQQYTASRAAYRAGPDGAILLRHDRWLLPALPADRLAGAIFCCSADDLLEALAEMPLSHAVSAGARLAGEYNAAGDRIDNQRGGAGMARIAARAAPAVADVQAGYGTALIARFVAAERARGVIVIGGLPTAVSTLTLTPALVAAIADVYRAQGGGFLVLANRSQYPPVDFFNSPDHLVQACQYRHSMAVAAGLAVALGRTLHPAPAMMFLVAAGC